MEPDTVAPASEIERPPFPNMYYSRFQLPFDPEFSETNLRILKEYIGKKGYNFNRLTALKKAKYIWYEKDYKAVEVYAKTTKLIAKVISALKVLLAETVLRIYTSGQELDLEENLLKWCAEIWKQKFAERTFYIASSETHLNLETFSYLFESEKL
jgi:hypothetical protein